MKKDPKAQKQNIFLKQATVLFLILLGLYLFLINPFLKEGKNILDEELEKKIKEVKRFIRESGAMPSKEYYLKLESENKELKESFVKFKDFIDPKKEELPSDSSEAGLYFTERLHSLVKKIEGLSSQKGIKVPENLGFSETFPKQEQVPVLLRQLDIIELACDALLSEGISQLSSLKPLKPIERMDEKTDKLFLKEVPVQITLKCETAVFVKLLLKLKESSPVVAVTEMHIKSDEESGLIEASLVLSSFILEG